ncbi:hypothetical protein, partial [Glutamicibacter arilaitensis]|uniref:hypothetical protein n=1 Tax=Glutamicibacter arilaitensis TaxID=256701 RepID=UPI00384D2616
MNLPDEHDDLGGLNEEPTEAATDEPEADPQPEFMFRDAEQWLQELALPNYLRKLGGAGHRWAPNWGLRKIGTEIHANDIPVS